MYALFWYWYTGVGASSLLAYLFSDMKVRISRERLNAILSGCGLKYSFMKRYEDVVGTAWEAVESIGYYPNSCEMECCSIPEPIRHYKPKIVLCIDDNLLENYDILPGDQITLELNTEVKSGDCVLCKVAERLHIMTYLCHEGKHRLVSKVDDTMCVEYRRGNSNIVICGKITDIFRNDYHRRISMLNLESKRNEMKFINTNFEDNHGVVISGTNAQVTIIQQGSGKQEAKVENPMEEVPAQATGPKRLISDLMDARDVDGKYILTSKIQWFAIYRVLTDKCGYPAVMSDFCKRIENEGLADLRIPCDYESMRPASQNLAKLSRSVDQWDQLRSISASYSRQVQVADYLLKRL